uniref:NADH-ubiquinone oxidoreductase chain 3 n=1 Tax=Malawimonas californiana TaxID=221722 RepID=A0A0B5GCR4_MALCL|nr:NADH dehydrogenase subunit 3 [Malawimonas californiana]AJF22881.1 NADH dehydrogenase subunit 3 [Malawimonas californiana]
MRLIWLDYFTIFIYIIIGILLSIIIITLSYVLVTQQYDNEKLSAYECGFSPFDDARSKFDVKFYLVSILFIIFDLEVTYLFPWITIISDMDILGYWSMFWFLIILTVGFIYEWCKGALEW